MRTWLAVLAIAALSFVTLGCEGDSLSSSIGEEQAACHVPSYLALGDSITFGQNILIEPTRHVDRYKGYPEFLSGMVDAKDVNASCPGETTGSFFDPTAVDNGCRDFRRSGTTDPEAPAVRYETLHVGYDGTQLEFAIDYLTNPRKKVSLVTLQLGANDLLLLLYGCLGDPTCVYGGIQGVLTTAGQNLATILYTIRSVGYTGQIVLPFYYSNNYADQMMTQASYALNQVIAQIAPMFGAQTADVFSAWYAASGGDPCAAGLLLKLPDGTCDKHPSRAGAKLMAETIDAVVP
jgi:lysophospholipase L1-like esterase